MRIASPIEFATLAPDLATVQQVALSLELAPIWRRAPPNVPEAALTGLRVTAVETPKGANNYTFPMAGGRAGPPRVGLVRVQDGTAELHLAHRQVDAQVALSTEPDYTITADLQGRYGQQRLTGRIRGAPWPWLMPQRLMPSRPG